MYFAVLFTALLALTSAQSYQDDEAWADFKLNYEKSYDNELEENFRYKIFMENKQLIEEHNELYNAGIHSYEQGLNEFADLLQSEFAERLLRDRDYVDDEQEDDDTITFVEPLGVRPPKKVDWRLKNAVTGVKHQGRCKAGYAFATTGALEGQHFRHHHHLISLSEQNIIDCSQRQGNHGCTAGSTVNSIQYIKMNGGIDSDHMYPYEGRQGHCRFDKHNIGAIAHGFARIRYGNESALTMAVAAVGPIAVSIDASQHSFRFYKRGIYNEPHCRSKYLNHDALVVGYDSSWLGHSYWIVKNSFGTGWGEKGYIRMSRNKHNQCGIASHAGYPLV